MRPSGLTSGKWVRGGRYFTGGPLVFTTAGAEGKLPKGLLDIFACRIHLAKGRARLPEPNPRARHAVPALVFCWRV